MSDGTCSASSHRDSLEPAQRAVPDCPCHSRTGDHTTCLIAGGEVGVTACREFGVTLEVESPDGATVVTVGLTAVEARDVAAGLDRAADAAGVVS